ncbi:hypothetical protein COL516b_001555 [Colletotrichum fioriniae]|nr:uncharacterized protein COL516b_001555 [Colletotrichum fioriniae]KAJ0312471.1 hypothetical protein COL516b_001555 [Colletotrichum fioriniae]
MTPPGTSRYEPPEMDKDRDKMFPAHETRSRAYDIWSIGCIVLEFLIWLAYGFDAVKKFQDETAYFWERERSEGNEKKYRVQTDTLRYIKSLSTTFQTPSAWRELLKLVETRLLVINVSMNWKVSSPQYRETGTVDDALDDALVSTSDYEHHDIKPPLPALENSLDDLDGLVDIERKATEELEPHPHTTSAAKDQDNNDR